VEVYINENLPAKYFVGWQSIKKRRIIRPWQYFESGCYNGESWRYLRKYWTRWSR
jgi:hypothetical protein